MSLEHVHLVRQVIGFSYFEFKIRLIRQGFSFLKQKFLYLNSCYTKEPNVSGRLRNSFGSLQSCFTDSS